MSTAELHRTAFDAVQRDAGATWTDWEGWAWAADFGDPVAEHSATRTACNMWDESPLRKWDMRGPDAVALADALFTNDMAALEIGQVRYGAICDDQGKMIMDGTVFRLADDHCLSITSYDSDLDWFRQVAADRGLDVAGRGPHGADAAPPDPGPQGRARCWGRSPRAPTSPRCATSGSSPRASRSAACRAGSPAPATPASSASSSTARPTTPLRCGTQCGRRPAPRPAPDRPVGDRDAADRVGAAVPGHRLLPAPDRSVRGPPGQRDQARQGRAISSAATRCARSPRRGRRGCSTTLRIEGEEVPEYGATVTHDGQEVGIVRSPCQSPTFDRQRDRDGGDRSRAGAGRTARRRRGGRRRRRRDRGAVPAL